MISIDDEWSNFLNNKTIDNNINTNNICIDEEIKGDAPECEDLYISTKTKVLFLNQKVDIHSIFWKLPIIEYWKPEEGIIKKQMKIVCKTQEEFTEYKNKLEGIKYYTENIIKQIDNPGARRIKFKDERKITIGLSKKDIMNSRGKVKNAFYNCFALIVRFRYQSSFKEIHVKIFNTGKLEIPGILNLELLDIVKAMIIKYIQKETTKQMVLPVIKNQICLKNLHAQEMLFRYLSHLLHA